MSVALIIIAAAVVALALLVVARRTQRSDDAVSDFRRQIDALSSDSRRAVTDRVRRLRDVTETEGTSSEVTPPNEETERGS